MKKQEILDAYSESTRYSTYPPLANRIIGLFMISDKRYLSFNEIREELDISKGALSKMLTLLLDLRRIVYIRDETNPRKRLFAIDIEGINDHLKMIADNFDKQRLLLVKSMEFRTNGDSDITAFIANSINFNEAMISELRKLTKKHFGK